ncbi:MAG: gluconate transporter [Spirochaetae bacterium HGW-Spirochaetae-5]|nr:MAG: gluconate transporter [Spirochaetae bacterium HGW-Spirochaetae-5]
MFSTIAYTVFILILALFVIFLTYRFKLNPFYILVPASFIFGMISGVSPANTITAVRNGFGATIGYYGILIIAGTAIAVIMEKTGAVTTITNSIMKIAGKKEAPAVLTITGSILSVSSPSESGFILFAPAGRLLEKIEGKKAGTVAVALAAGIYTVHSILPPSAGPIAAAGILGAGIWKIILIGIASSAAGVAASYFWCRKFVSGDTDITNHLSDRKHIIDKDLPTLGFSILPIAVPLFFITLRSFTTMSSRPFGSGKIAALFEFTGDPSTSMLIGLFLTLVLLKRKDFGKTFSEWGAESIERSAKLLIIAGSGGAFGAVLKASSLTKTISETFVFTGAGLLLPFLIAAAVKTINGSSTIAIITASSLSASFSASIGLDPAFTVAAITAGSMAVSHVNDPYFWIVSQHSGIGVKDSYKYFTTATLIAAISSFAVIWILSFIF